MRKAIIAGLLAATIVPTVAQAQHGELLHDRQQIWRQQREARDAIRHGAPLREVRAQQRDVREARQEYREDWRAYRSHHPDIYRGPAWSGPRGYRWHPVRAGYRFEPAFYGRSYWIDPYRYHLRPVPGYERWVRYGRDVVLVDVRNGRVLEVYSGFFF